MTTLNGVNDEEVRLYYDAHVPKSIGNSTTLPKDITNRAEAKAVIMALSEMVAIRLRRHDFVAGGMHLGIKYNDLSYIGKQIKLPLKINSANSLCDCAMQIYDSFRLILPIRALSVSTFDLSSGSENIQLSLLDDIEKATNFADLTSLWTKYEKIRLRCIKIGVAYGISFYHGRTCRQRFLIPLQKYFLNLKIIAKTSKNMITKKSLGFERLFILM